MTGKRWVWDEVKLLILKLFIKEKKSYKYICSYFNKSRRKIYTALSYYKIPKNYCYCNKCGKLIEGKNLCHKKYCSICKIDQTKLSHIKSYEKNRKKHKRNHTTTSRNYLKEMVKIDEELTKKFQKEEKRYHKIKNKTKRQDLNHLKINYKIKKEFFEKHKEEFVKLLPIGKERYVYANGYAQEIQKIVPELTLKILKEGVIDTNQLIKEAFNFLFNENS